MVLCLMCSDRLLLADTVPSTTSDEDPGRSCFSAQMPDIMKVFHQVGSPRSHVTMAGHPALQNTLQCAIHAVKGGLEGDFLEGGVWRGGNSIILAAVAQAANKCGRNITVWVADSFMGLPLGTLKDQQMAHIRNKPVGKQSRSKKPLKGVALGQWTGSSGRWTLAVKGGVEAVRGNFARLNVLGPHVRFLPGWFNATIPAAPITKLALLRVDGDLYSSTWDLLAPLYPRTVPGACIIFDDYGVWPQSKLAVDDYFRGIQVDPHLKPVGGSPWFMYKPADIGDARDLEGGRRNVTPT